MNWMQKITQQEPIILFHGTIKKKLPSIMKNGLRPGDGWGGAGTFGVYLSSTIDSALYWAKISYLRSIDEKIDVNRFDRKYNPSILSVVRVSIPREYLHNLKADMEQAEDVQYEGDEGDWEGGLKIIGDVRYDGVIPPSWILI